MTNTGNVTLTGISLSDDNDEDDLSCPGDTLPPGEDLTCTATHEVTQQELDDDGSPTPGSGVLYNEVTATSNEAPDATDDLSIPIRFAQVAHFRVFKDFSDDNPGEVEVFISCNTGLPLDQRKVITEEDGVEFVVGDFDQGEMDCDIFENPVPAGYSDSYDASAEEDGIAGTISHDEAGCHFENVTGGHFVCVITNDLDPVDIVVEKEWIGEYEENAIERIASADYTCYNVRESSDGETTTVSGGLTFKGDDTDTIDGVYPDYDGSSWCTVDEVDVESYIEADDSDCEELLIEPGSGNSCTIVNVLFFEGIPTLSQYGLALLALLMLGVGAIGFRRFV